MNILDIIVCSKRLQFPPSSTHQNGSSKCDEGKTELRKTQFPNSFVESLKQDQVSIIGEVKPSSPSGGKLLKREGLMEILSVYKRHCAAVSVLTDEQFFSGSFELLKKVKQATGLPVLCKDFIVSTEQISLAKQHGADAILLIAKILTPDELVTLANSAIDHGLCPVVEINNVSEARLVATLNVEVVLINNRNLDTMQIDLCTTSLLSGILRTDQLLISASGIKTTDDIRALLPSSKRFLIGTSLMQSADPESLLVELKNSSQIANAPASPQIKVCGITNTDDARLALAAGAEFIGLIFAPSSQRKVSTEVAKDIISAVEKRAKLVGVFQNQDIEEVNRIAEELDVDFIQLHGDEDSDYAHSCVRPVIKAFAYSSTHRGLLQFSGADYYLFDLDKNSSTEETKSTDRFAALAKSIAPIREKLPPFFLAGKLSPNNVQQAFQAVLPFALDVASGVEEYPGKKSIPLTNQFCKLARLS